MARAKLPRCRVCDVKKTKENTCVRGDGYFMDLCKLCDSERTLKRRLDRMSTEQLVSLYVKHTCNAEKISRVLQERYLA